MKVEAREETRSAMLHVRESGRPGFPAIVFLHGVGNSGGMSRRHMAQLATYHCLAPDLPGFGQSNSMRWISRLETAELVAEVIETRVPEGRPMSSASPSEAPWRIRSSRSGRS